MPNTVRVHILKSTRLHMPSGSPVEVTFSRTDQGDGPSLKITYTVEIFEDGKRDQTVHDNRRIASELYYTVVSGWLGDGAR